MNDHLGVGIAAELMTPCAQPLAQGFVVVDLTVEHDRDRAIFVVNGLRTAWHVDNGEPSHRQADRARVHRALAVRATPDDDIAHRLKHGGRPARECYETADSAHKP